MITCSWSDAYIAITYCLKILMVLSWLNGLVVIALIKVIL